MTTIPDHYAALGIDPTADPEVITAAYRALAKKFHPDTGAATGTASAERFDAIQKAYEVLRSPESRHAYDLELLAATEAELEAHIASKRRVVPRQAAPEQAAPPPPDLDLGDIRPEPAVPPRAAAAAAKRKQRSLFPVIVPLVLMLLIGAAAAWVFLPVGPSAPPLPGEKADVAEAIPQKPAPAAPKPAAEAKPAAAQPAAGEAPAEPPVFGSTGTESNPPEIEEAAATPEAVPAPDAAGSNGAAKSDKPVFGSTSESAAPVAAPDAPAATPAAPPPVPKAKPAPPVVKQAQKPATPAKPVQKQAVQKPPVQQQPRAKLVYQDPPQYYPEPDGYPPPPPGMEPPGYGPDGYAPDAYDPEMPPPPGFRPPGGGPYRLVIWERLPGRPATAWSAGLVFKSMGKCTRQGVKAVLRRTGGMEPDGARVWYECQQLSQR